MDAITQVLVATIGALATISAGAFATVAWSTSARLQKRADSELALSTQFPDDSPAARSLTVTARNAACELAARRLVTGRASRVTLAWATTAAAAILAMWTTFVAVTSDLREESPQANLLEVIVWVLALTTYAFAVGTQVHTSTIVKSIRDSLVADGWYLDVSENDTLIVMLGQDHLRYRKGAPWSRRRVPHKEGDSVVIRRLETRRTTR